MLKALLSTVALVLLFAPVAHAVEPGVTVATPCPFGDCKAAIGLSFVGEFSITTGTLFDGVEFDPSKPEEYAKKFSINNIG